MRALGFAHLLHDHLLGSLRGDAAELDGIDLLFEDIAELGVGLALLRLVQGVLGSRLFELFVGDYGPATERLVVAGLAIDLHPQLDIIFIAFLGRRGQSQLQRLENHTGRYALFIGHRLNNQQYFFAHRTPRLSQSIGPAGIRPSVKTGNDVGFVDRIDRQQVFVIVDQHHYVLFFRTAEDALKITPPIEGRTQLDLDLLTGMSGELFQGEQWPVHSRRRDFEGVFAGDGILHIEHTADLATDLFTVLDQNSIGAIDVDPQQRMLTLRNEFDAPALVTQGFHYRRQHGLQLF